MAALAERENISPWHLAASDGAMLIFVSNMMNFRALALQTVAALIPGQPMAERYDIPIILSISSFKGQV